MEELAMLMQEFLHQWWMGFLKSCRQAQARPQPNFETACALRGSAAEYLDFSPPVDDMRKRLRELQQTVWGTNAHMRRRVLEREAIERGHLDEQTLLDRRRHDQRP